MPYNGEKNLKFGVFKSLCCGEEIILPEGKTFPYCPKHPNLTTLWKPLVGDRFPSVAKRADAASHTPRFHVRDRVQVVGLDPNRGRFGVIVDIIESTTDYIHRYEVQFSDDTKARYFGFQLQLFQAESSRSA